MVHAAAWYLPVDNNSAAFLNGNIVTVHYTDDPVCTPPIASSYPNISRAIQNVTQCGVVIPKNVIGTFPIWAIVPAFAGFSVYGFPEYNSTPDGFPVYNGNVIITDCGGGLSKGACGLTPPFRYTLSSYKYEQAYGIYNGTHGMPEGLLPFPAHDYITLNDYGGYSTPLYIVFVRVFDPNIYPNATTGKCTQVAPSNLSNPTENCLTSFSALRNAIATKNSYIPQINANNKLWYLESNRSVQAIIVLNNNITGLSNLLYPNSNIYLFTQTNDTPYYVYKGTPSAAASSNIWVIIVGIIALGAIAVNVYWFKKRSKRKKTG